MKLDDIPAEAWRRAVETELRNWMNGMPVFPTTIARYDGALDAIRNIKDEARRIAAEMAEAGTPPTSENGGG